MARIHGICRSKEDLDDVPASLEQAGLWNEVKDRLLDPGTGTPAAGSASRGRSR